MKKLLGMAILFLITQPASAQQPTATPDLQACQSMLFERLQRELSVRAEGFTLAAENVRLKSEIAALKKQYEAKPEPAQKP